MANFKTQQLPLKPDVIAPDGSDVRILLALKGGSMAHFELPANRISLAVAHRTVEEIWYFLTGEGEMWRKEGAEETIVSVHAGTCLTIPLGTHFQFRSLHNSSLAAVSITMPPWPGDDEAYVVPGPWKPI